MRLRYVNLWWWEKHLSKRRFIKDTYSWQNKLTVNFCQKIIPFFPFFFFVKTLDFISFYKKPILQPFVKAADSIDSNQTLYSGQNNEFLGIRNL